MTTGRRPFSHGTSPTGALRGAILRGRSAEAAPDLADLLRRAGRADEAAFAQLYDATSRRVFGLALRVVRDPAQAEEVTQEAFLEIWRTAGRFDADKGSPLAWLLTITHRKAVDRVRSAEASTRRDTTYHQSNQPVDHDTTAEAAHASLEAHRVRGALRDPHRGAARGHQPRLLRWLHPHGGGDHARPTGRHRQDTDPRRPDPAARRDGSGSDQ